MKHLSSVIPWNQHELGFTSLPPFQREGAVVVVQCLLTERHEEREEEKRARQDARV
jgi:hypothetical protein